VLADVDVSCNAQNEHFGHQAGGMLILQCTAGAR
jgi:hypothetical protein